MKLLRKFAAALAIIALIFQVTPVFAATAHTWTQIHIGSGVIPTAVASDADGSNIIAAVSGGRLFTSDDGGASWTERQPAGNTNLNWNSVASDADGSNLIATVFSGRLYTSSDGGANWIERQPQGDMDGAWYDVASDADGSNLIATDVFGPLYTSSDGGANWTEREPGGGQLGGATVASDADGSNLIVGAFSGLLYTSDDGGVSWTPHVGSKDWKMSASDDDGSHLLAGSAGAFEDSGRLFMSDDSGETWEELQPAGDVDRYWGTGDIDTDGAHIIVGSAHTNEEFPGRLYSSDDGGDTWVEEQPTAEQGISWSAVALDDDGTNFMVSSYNYGFFLSPDTIPPAIGSLSPEDDETNIGITSDLAIIFNEDIATSTGDISIYKTEGDELIETIDVAGPRVTIPESDVLSIDPTALLEYETEYYVLIDEGAVEDLLGNDFAGISDESDWSFTTQDAPPPLAVSSLNPEDNAVNVSIDGSYSITFNQDVTLGTGNVTLYRADDDTPVATFDVTDDESAELEGTSLALFGADELEINTEYYFLSDAGIVEDLSGNPFVGISDPTTWSFTTDTPPVISYFSPEDGATNVAVNVLSDEYLVIGFDQDIEVGTGNVTVKKSSDDSVVVVMDVTDEDVSSVGGTTVEFYPNVTLDYATDYYVLADAGIVEDESGAPFAGIADETTWNFTTQGTPPPNAELDELKNKISFDGSINAVATDGTTLYVGGNFDFVAGGGTTGGGVPFDEITQMPIGVFPAVEDGGFVETVISDGEGGWYVGGSFESVGGVERNDLAHITSEGAVDENFDPNIDNGVSALVLSSDGSILYAGGQFTTVNGDQSRTSIAAFDTATGIVTDFEPDVLDGYVTDMLLTPDDGTLYVSGNFSNVGDTARRNAAAFDTNTSALTSFDPSLKSISGSTKMAYDEGLIYLGGMYQVNYHEYSDQVVFNEDTEEVSALPTINNGDQHVAAVPDGVGGWYVGGDFTILNDSIERNYLAHILSDGTVDPDFDPDLDNWVTSLALSSDGETLYAGGPFSAVNGEETTRHQVAAFDTETGLATSFDPDIPGGSATFVALSSDDETLYVTGGFTEVNGDTPRNYAAAFDTTTGTATAFDPNLGYVGNDIELAGSIVYISGSFSEVNGDTARNGLASFDATTGDVTAFDPNTPSVTAIAVEGSTVYAVGSFTSVNDFETSRNYAAAFDATTGIATAFNPNLDSYSGEIAVSDDGSVVYIAGSFATVNGDVARNGFAAVDSTTGAVTDLVFEIQGQWIREIAVDGPNVYLGGFFTLYDYVERNGVAAVDATTGIVTEFDPNVNSTVRSLRLSDDGNTLYVGGQFSEVNGGTERNNLAAFDTTTGIATAFDPDINGQRVATIDFSSDGNTLYAGGNFTTVNGDIPRENFAEFDLDTSNVTDFDAALNGQVYTLDVADGLVYIGGSFTTTGASTRHNLAAIDLSSYTLLPFNPDVNNNVNALALSPDGLTLYVGGQFTSVNDGAATRNRLAAFTTADGVVTAFNPNAASTVNALELSADGSILYAGGAFQTVNGATQRRRIASFTTSNGTVTAFNPNVSSTVNALDLSSGGLVLYAGGQFTTVNNGSVSRSRVASFTTADGVATVFDPNVDSTVSALKLALDESTIFTGGSFEEVNGGDATRNFLAEFSTTDGVVTDFAPNPNGTVRGLDLSSDGSTLYVGGDFSLVDGQERYRIANINTTSGELGTLSPSSEDMDSSVRTLLLSPDQSELYVGGDFTGNLAIYTLIEDEVPPDDDEDDNHGGGGGSSGSSSHRSSATLPPSGSSQQSLLELLRSLITQFIAQGGTPTPQMLAFLGTPTTTNTTYTRDLDLNSEGSDVTALQLFLIAQNKGPQAQALAVVGATGFFGPLTQAALAEYQASVGISPAAGYFGPITRAYVNNL